MTLPKGILNLQQVVRDLEERLSAIEEKLIQPEVPDGPAEETSKEEPPAVD